MKKDIGIYIHIPFCKSKCYYCDFISYSNKSALIKSYIDALIKEIKHIDFSKYSIKTIYIGGGTPSILDSKDIIEIIKNVIDYMTFNAEITIEVNPGTVTEKKLKDYKEAKINRLSIGLQSTDENMLKQIGRIHNAKEFFETYKMARNVGFKNINIDLMLGLPNQTLEILEKSVQEVIKLNPEHISIYSLILEENTRLYEMINNGKLKLLDDELERKMYWKVKKMLEQNGYNHYEISNFSKDKYNSIHNSDCWEQKEYIGIGVAAHSYLEGKRYSNITCIEEYINNINNNEFSKNIIIHEEQTKENMEKEYIILGLRKLKGINISKYKNKFGENPIYKYKKELNKLVREGLIEINNNHIKLTNKGLDFANLVWEEFI